MDLSILLAPTRILDFDAPEIQSLIEERDWKNMSQEMAAKEIYNFCKDEIPFGYNSQADDMPASAVLRERLGHCNTKSTLLMALLRAIGIPCRLHGFTIDKKLQKDAITGLVYWLAPKEIVHTFVEAFFQGKWISLEGLILDREYLQSVQEKYPDCHHPFLGFAVATRDLQNPNVEWTGNSTFIQSEGIRHRFGIFNSPDEFFKKHPTNLTGIKGWLYRHYFYKKMNEHIAQIRNSGVVGSSSCCAQK